ncbi:MAG: sirohydrochlorin cobaltochelatase [Prevotella sp.]|jgi:sirohydrochlorin cobaltochelatase|nr:sirohydrochlorin cobaltochelatase [Prevotella sp.]
MRNLIILLFLCSLTVLCRARDGENFVASDILASMKPGDKAAILMVHFGTTHADTRELTIDALNNKVKQQFPDIELREAYTSRIVIKHLGNKGIVKENPLEALRKLHAEGYTHILIQPSTIIDGVEMESLDRNVTEVRDLFKDIRTGNPLLYDPHDYESVIEVITKSTDKQTAYVLVGHGTYDATTAQYAMLDYMLKIKGHKNFFVGTIEGYPGYDDVLIQLKQSGLKKIVLVPFMFVAGEHAKNDIAGDCKENLDKEGYVADVIMEGLGQNSGMQDIFISHLKFITKHRKLDIMDKKAGYQETGKKE